MTALHLAVAKDYAKITAALLKQGANINQRNNQGETPLMLKVKNAQGYYTSRELLPLLLKSGADAALLDKDGRSIWQIVCELKTRPPEALQRILEAGVSPTITNQLGQNALHLGAKHKIDGYLIERFIQAGSNPDATDHSGRLPLHWLLDDFTPFQLSSQLFKSTTDFNVADWEGNTPLHLACLNGNSSIMVNLLARGADSSLKNKLGDTPLWLSVGKNNVPNNRSSSLFRGSMQAVHLLPSGITNDIINSAGAGDMVAVKKLLSMEPRLITVEREGHNALHAAAYSNQREMVDYLLSAGARMDDFTATALGDLAFLEKSLKGGSTAAQQTQKLNQLLTQAARGENPEMISWLVEQGAKPQEAVAPQTGISALGQAIKLDRMQTAGALRRHGAHPTPFDVVFLNQPMLTLEAVQYYPDWLNQTNDQGVTPLMKAIKDRALECARALLENGADPNLETPILSSLHTTTLQQALQYNPKAVNLLLEYKPDLKRANLLGFTPLHIAAWYGSTNLLNYALDHGVDINERQQQPSFSPAYKNTGQTALHLAVIKGSTNMVTFLLQKGASLEATNNLGQKPIDLLPELKKNPSPPDDKSRRLIRAPMLLITYPPSPRPTEVWLEIEKILLKKP